MAKRKKTSSNENIIKAGKPGRPKESKSKGRKKVVQPFVRGLPEDLVSESISLSVIVLDDESYKFRIALRIGDLQKSIAEYGQQIPVILRPHPEKNHMYQIISGFRRIAAIKKLGWSEVSAIIRKDVEDDFDAFKVSIIENESRKTYNDLDRGYAIVKAREHGRSVQEVCELFNIGRRQMERLQSLTEFPKLVQKAIVDNKMTATHALMLRRMAHQYGELDAKYWVGRIVKEELSVEGLKRAINVEMKKEPKEKEIELFVKEEIKDKKKKVVGEKLRLRPVSINPKELTKEQLKKLKADLRAILKFLT